MIDKMQDGRADGGRAEPDALSSRPRALTDASSSRDRTLRSKRLCRRETSPIVDGSKLSVWLDAIH